MKILDLDDVTKLLKEGKFTAIFHDGEWHVSQVDESHRGFYLDVENGVIDGHFDGGIVGVADNLKDAIIECMHKIAERDIAKENRNDVHR